jgi:hypothetical protein
MMWHPQRDKLNQMLCVLFYLFFDIWYLKFVIYLEFVIWDLVLIWNLFDVRNVSLL